MKTHTRIKTEFYMKYGIGKHGQFYLRYFINGTEVFFDQWCKTIAMTYYYEPVNCGLQSVCRG